MEAIKSLHSLSIPKHLNTPLKQTPISPESGGGTKLSGMLDPVVVGQPSLNSTAMTSHLSNAEGHSFANQSSVNPPSPPKWNPPSPPKWSEPKVSVGFSPFSTPFLSSPVVPDPASTQSFHSIQPSNGSFVFGLPTSVIKPFQFQPSSSLFSSVPFNIVSTADKKVQPSHSSTGTTFFSSTSPLLTSSTTVGCGSTPLLSYQVAQLGHPSLPFGGIQASTSYHNESTVVAPFNDNHFGILPPSSMCTSPSSNIIAPSTSSPKSSFLSAFPAVDTSSVGVPVASTASLSSGIPWLGKLSHRGSTGTSFLPPSDKKLPPIIANDEVNNKNHGETYDSQNSVEVNLKETQVENQHDISGSDDDVIFVCEDLPDPILIKKAEELLLPKTFYLYEKKPTCSGCRGCLSDDQVEHVSSKLEPTAFSDADIGVSDHGEAESAIAGFSSSGLLSFTDLVNREDAFSKSFPGFQFDGAGKQLFGRTAKEDDNPEAEADIEFRPIVSLPETYSVKSWDEDTKVLFCHRAKLYRFDEAVKQWKERGVGDMKIVQHNETKKVCLIMRRDQIFKLCCNHYLTEGMQLKQQSEKSWMWFTHSDFSGDQSQPEMFAIKFKSAETGLKFKKTFDECVAQLELTSKEGHRQKTISQTPLKEMFKVAVDSWECPVCLIRNQSNECKCAACGHKSPIVSNSTTATTVKLGSTGGIRISSPMLVQEVEHVSSDTSKLKPTPLSEANSVAEHRKAKSATAAGFSSCGLLSFTDLVKQEDAFPKSFLGFQFDGAGKQLFGFTVKEEDNPEAEADIEFRPIVSLPETYSVKSWDEDAKVLFCHRAKLYRFDEAVKQWKERGVGDMKIVQHNETKKICLIMRRDQIFKLCCNHYLNEGMQLKQQSEKSWMWFTHSDFSGDEPQPEKFAIKFKSAETGLKFKKTFDECVAQLELKSKEEHPRNTVSETPLKELFKVDVDSWECPVGLIRNQNKESECAACGHKSPGILISTAATNVTLGSTGDIRISSPMLLPTKASTDLAPVSSDAGGIEIPQLQNISGATSNVFNPVQVSENKAQSTINAVETNPAEDELGHKSSCISNSTTATNVTPGSTGGIRLSSPMLLPTKASTDPAPVNTVSSNAGGIKIPLLQNFSVATSNIFNPVQVSENKAQSTVNPMKTNSTEDELGHKSLCVSNSTSATTVTLGSTGGIHISSPMLLPREASTDPVPVNTVSFNAGGIKIPLLQDISLTTSNVFNPVQVSENKAQSTINPIKTNPTLDEHDADPQSSPTPDTFLEPSPPLQGYEHSGADEHLPHGNSIGTSFLFASDYKLPPMIANDEVGNDRDDDTFDSENSVEVNLKISQMENQDHTSGSDEDVIFVREDFPDPILIKKAEELLLPKTFYLYEKKSPCSGCRGCLSDDQVGHVSSDISKLEPAAFSEADSGVSDHREDKSASAGFSSSGLLSFTDLVIREDAFPKSFPGFQFDGAGKQLFGCTTKEDDNPEAEADIEFRPIVSLPETYSVKSWDEDTKVLFCHRAKLYRFDEAVKQWKERGVGDMKIVQHNETKKVCLIMRRDQIFKLCCNHYLNEGMQLKQQSEKSWMWFTHSDFSGDEPQPEKFAIKFKSAETGLKFKKTFDECVTQLELKPKEEHPRKTTSETPLKEIFKADVDSWECPVCLIRNQRNESKCVACGHKSPSISKSTTNTTVTFGSTGGIRIPSPMLLPITASTDLAPTNTVSSNAGGIKIPLLQNITLSTSNVFNPVQVSENKDQSTNNLIKTYPTEDDLEADRQSSPTPDTFAESSRSLEQSGDERLPET